MGTLSRVFQELNSSPDRTTKINGVPMLNVISNSLSGYINAYGQTAKKRSLINWYKAIPELTALANKVAKDVVYKYKFVPVLANSNGRNKILTANKFALEIDLRNTMRAQVIDSLVTGESFGWLGKISDKIIKKEINNTLKKHGFKETKSNKAFAEEILNEFKETDRLANTLFIDEHVLKPRKYRYVASSTMEIIHNQ